MLTFDEKRHIYRWNGVMVPSVTQVLKGLEDYSRIPAQILESKTDLGRRVHDATAIDDQENIDEMSIDDEVRPYLEAWRWFCLDHDPEFSFIEKPLYNEQYCYAGTPDRVAVIDSVVTLIEIKTVHTMSAVTSLQTAGYAGLFCHPNKVMQNRIAVHLRNDGGYKIHKYNDEKDIHVFLSQLKVTQWRNANGY